MPQVLDEVIVARLKHEESASFELLYQYYFTTIANYIRKNSGTDQDAEDIFQETIVILLSKVRQPHFILTSSLKTYLFSIARNLWLKKLRDDNPVHTSIVLDVTEPIDSILEQEEIGIEQKISTWLLRITANCQRILKAIFYLNEPMDSLMIKMGWKNKHTATNQKYKCIEQIRKESKK